MGKKLLDITISEYNEVDRKAYFRNAYHGKINKADVNSVKRIQKKRELIRMLIEDVGMNELFDIYKTDILKVKPNLVV